MPHRVLGAAAHARKNAPPAGVLTMPASAPVIHATANNQLGQRVIRAAVAKPRRRGRYACGAFFELSLPGSPHRAADPTWHRRKHPLPADLVASAFGGDPERAVRRQDPEGVLSSHWQ